MCGWWRDKEIKFVLIWVQSLFVSGWTRNILLFHICHCLCLPTVTLTCFLLFCFQSFVDGIIVFKMLCIHMKKLNICVEKQKNVRKTRCMSGATIFIQWILVRYVCLLLFLMWIFMIYTLDDGLHTYTCTLYS